jgi:hypothetical protein
MRLLPSIVPTTASALPLQTSSSPEPFSHHCLASLYARETCLFAIPYGFGHLPGFRLFPAILGAARGIFIRFSLLLILPMAEGEQREYTAAQWRRYEDALIYLCLFT